MPTRNELHSFRLGSLAAVYLIDARERHSWAQLTDLLNNIAAKPHVARGALSTLLSLIPQDALDNLDDTTNDDQELNDE